MVRTEDHVRARPSQGAGMTAEATPLALSKHEAAGNDFLVVVDLARAWDLGAAEARWLCDRRLGVGADGLLVCGPAAPGSGASVSMVLYNADGSRAEMSGNGVRCLVQAAVLGGAVPPGTVRVSTDAGVRTVELSSGADGAAEGWASVDMGRVRLQGEVASPVSGARARLADVGNPHLVVAGDVGVESLDLASVHRKVTELLGAPVNVEVVRPEGRAALAMRVFERGVGETAACGTGSCAAAAVARSFGMVGDVVTVANPGGPLEVRLPPAPGDPDGDADGPAVLAGPVRHVADVLVDPARLGAPAGGAGADAGAPAPMSGVL